MTLTHLGVFMRLLSYDIYHIYAYIHGCQHPQASCGTARAHPRAKTSSPTGELPSNSELFSSRRTALPAATALGCRCAEAGSRATSRRGCRQHRAIHCA